MDHLPAVANAYKPIEVPYHGYPYESHSFTDFPIPSELQLSALQGSTISLAVAKHAAPYLQARFFFGILHEVLGMPVDRSHFIKEENGHEYVTTEQLHEYMRRWRSARAARDDASRQIEDVRALDCLRSAYYSWRAIPQFAEIVRPEVELSIQLVACALEHAIMCVKGVEVKDGQWRLSRSEFLASRMIEEKWCPSLVWQIGKSGPTWQYFAWLLGPPRNRREHKECKEEDRCLIDRERATDLDNASQHICGDKSACPEIMPRDREAVAAIVREGGIPLLEYRNGVLHVTRHATDIQYTAISHIWTDGLGNPEKNSMPHCQLNRLTESMALIPWTERCQARLLIEDIVWQSDENTVNLTPDPVKAKAERPLFFWIDTICVPQDPELKKAAISHMRAIYNRANRVLVFDAGLTGVGGQLQAEEILARVMLSNWIRRFWTLQEAVLAKVLWFRFRDDCYRQMSPDGDLRELTWLNEVNFLCDHLELDWRKHRIDSWSVAKRMIYVYSALKQREASFEEDQPICIATLLDMDVNRIQQEAGFEARWRQLWLEVKSVPKRILFMPGPKMTDFPLRWAPASFHGLDALPEPPGVDEEAKPSADGLRVRHHAIVSLAKVSNSSNAFFPMQVGVDVYLIRENQKRHNPLWQGLNFEQFDSLAVLLQQYEMQDDAELVPFTWALGALVGVQSDTSNLKAGHIKCQYLRTVSVLRYGSDFEVAYRKASPLAVEVTEEMIVPATWSHNAMRIAVVSAVEISASSGTNYVRNVFRVASRSYCGSIAFTFMALSNAANIFSLVAKYAVLGAGGGIILKNHVVDITPINGKSMNPTLSPDIHETGQRDYLLWKMYQPTKDLKRGDLVLFMCPSNPDTVVVKRVIATGGDKVQLDPKRQPGFDKSFNELRPEDLAAAERWNSYGGSLMVPFGHVWVEGDNWRVTRDSNDYGPVSKSLIIGKALAAIYPAKICFTKPWEGYRSKTKVTSGDEVLPRFWLE